MTTRHTVNLLKLHHANLERCNTFEEYKAAHLEYIKILIERAELEIEEQRDALER